MTPFLKLVADDIYERFNGHMEDIAVVFPNKRASLFFSKYLLEKNSDKAMWSPRYMTIGELFQQRNHRRPHSACEQTLQRVCATKKR